jgi:hypothetical protein
MNHPYFLWDYDLTEDQVKSILASGNDTENIWLRSRILESAHFNDVWKYMSLSELRKWYPKLKLKKPIKRAWDLALRVWQ